jgi:hypothetical protein
MFHLIARLDDVDHLHIFTYFDNQFHFRLEDTNCYQNMNHERKFNHQMQQIEHGVNMLLAQLS